MFFLIPTVAAVIGIPYVYLKLRSRKLAGEDLSQYDTPIEPFAIAEPSEGLDALNAYIHEMFVVPAQSGMANSGWEAKRERFDEAGLARTFPDDVEFRTDTITVDGQEISGAWTLLPNSDPNKRLLYVHGGAFTVGSDISHRPLTVQLARRTGMAVFAPNYRLMPENSRFNTIEDARAAYNWILNNGPDGEAPIEKLALAGDSAGGNLVLMLSNWARGHSDRQPDAVVAFSPTTDATLSSPSMRRNLDTDHMLRPMLKPILKMPKLFLLPAMQHHYRMSPSHPDQSPVYDDLSNLPPTLVQASSDEVLRDDAVRFVNKGQAAGSPVELQMWGGGLPHVWQIFDEYIAEAGAALDEVQSFLAKHV
ncbi:MAG: alpha/beta hydrolase [Litorimonas sp.]